ncbi:MAG: formylglycine-generating enzyme family protein [Pseudomonadota bacterium]
MHNTNGAPRTATLLMSLCLALHGCSVTPASQPAAVQDSGTFCAVCPTMVTVEAGSFLLGSSADEPGRVDDEGPQRRIKLASFAVAKHEVTVGEFARFVRQTGYDDGAGCLTMTAQGTWSYDPDASWRNPGFSQGDDHPVVCVTWHAANAYVDWLNTMTNGTPYRLLSESEWAYSARAGATTPYWWGENENDFCQYTNGVDKTAKATYPGWQLAGDCDDGFLYTAPVGHYQRANAFGLEDMVGNVWEWVADCYAGDYNTTPTDGSPVTAEACEKHVMRGGAWGDYGSFYLRTAYRGAWDGSQAFGNIGFRVVMTLREE